MRYLCLTFVLTLFACGVPQEEHDAAVGALESEVSELTTSVEALETSLSGVQAELEGSGLALVECQSNLRVTAQRLQLYRDEAGIDTDDIATSVEEYRQMVELTLLEAKVISTYVNGDIPGVRIRVRNNGARTITRMRVRLVWTDAAGQPIGESETSPVYTEGLMRPTSPLRPGYVQEHPSERDRYTTHDDIPSELWEGGSVRMEIIELEFEE